MIRQWNQRSAYKEKYVDEIRSVTDDEAFKAAKEFAVNEGVLIGISAGSALAVAIQVAKELGKGKKVLAIAPDGGEKYISMGLYD